MTERERMWAGLIFDPNGMPGNEQDIERCLELCHRYNQCSPADKQEKQRILGEMLGHMGENVNITAPFWCDHGYNISVGDNFYSNHNLVITDGVSVTIGDNVFIAPNCCITTAEHAIHPSQRTAGLELARPIKIGNNVWIGAGAVVLSGVTIGDNSVIGAGSVVRSDIPPNVVAVGVPCRVLREITDEDILPYEAE